MHAAFDHGLPSSQQAGARVYGYSAEGLLCIDQPIFILLGKLARGADHLFDQWCELHGLSLVASLARPGGNVTGLSNQAADLAAKRLELLREVAPGLRRLAIMANIDYPAVVLEMREFQAAAGTLGLEVATLEIRRGEDIVPAFEAIEGRTDALYVCADPLVVTHQVRINTLALAARLPTMHSLREHVETGGLMSYGPNFPDLFRRAADYVDKILRGAKPSDLPVEQPTKFDFVVNVTTAKALGLNVPQTLLARADEVIE